MTDLVEAPAEWVVGIYQLETNDPVMGGADGIDNLQAKQLAKRTAYLKQQVEAAQGDLTTHEAAADPHPVYLTSAEGDAKVAAAVAALVAASPATLDTLNELAAALGNDANFAATLTGLLALKAPLASPALTGTPTAPTPALGDRTPKIATMACFSQEFGASLTSAGYQKLPSGLIIQWGSTADVTAGGTTVVNYPIAFPNGMMGLSVSPSFSTVGAAAAYMSHVNTSNSQMTINNTGAVTCATRWIAIGY